jgi:hypothetical protein
LTTKRATVPLFIGAFMWAMTVRLDVARASPSESPSAPKGGSLENDHAPIELSENEDFQQLSPGELKLMSRLIEKSDGRWNQYLVGCLARRVGKRPALLAKDVEGRTLLENLALWMGMPSDRPPPDPSLESTELVGELLRECADPGAITQGVGLHNTCAAASIQFMLAKGDPAELGRIMRGLAIHGRAVLRSGDWLSRVRDSVTPDRYVRDRHGKIHQDPNGPIADTRNAIDRLFQAALMDFANGSDRYSDKADLSYSGGFSYTGLYPQQQQRALEAVFGARYFQARGPRGLTILKNVLEPILVDLRWLNGSHAIVVDRIENGRVYFHNPFGPWPGSVLSILNDPLRRVEDQHGRESMRLDDFEHAFQCAYLGERSETYLGRSLAGMLSIH